MTLLVRQRRWVKSRLAAVTRTAVVAAIALGSGCAIAPSAGTFIPLQPAEGARWVPAETVLNYGCEAGALVCSADGGRLSQRQCRCSEAR